MRSFILRVIFLLWLAVLAFGLPEVFAGTGNGWLTRFDVYILALPLYALHFMLLCHIAVKTKRTSWPALYLFGVIFGLYESWITKVIWNGYPGSDGFSMGSFGDYIGVHETLGLVLFYHPVTSFLLPLAVVSRLFSGYQQHFPVPDWVFGKTRWGLIRRVFLLLLWGLISGHNMPVPAEYLYSWISMIAVLMLGYWLMKSRDNLRLSSPVLSWWGLGIVLVWLTFIYGVTYIYILPDSRPPGHIQLITLAAYPILIWLIWLTKPRVPLTAKPEQTNGWQPLVWLLGVFIIGLFTSVGITAGAGIVMGVAVTPFLAMLVLGVGLFTWLIGWKTLLRR